MERFEINEQVDLLISNADGEVFRHEGIVLAMADNSWIVRSFSPLGSKAMRFMYSAPDDMWLRVVPDGETVECTRMVKSSKIILLPKMNKAKYRAIPSLDELKKLLDEVKEDMRAI